MIHTISIGIVILGECCLLLDLGNRVFGAYARTLVGAVARISMVVIACIVLALPLLGVLLVPGSGFNRWSVLSLIASIVVIGHYLFPYRFGIRKTALATVSESHRRLTDSVDPDKSQFPTAKMVVNIGLNQVRFPYPVKSGSNVRAKSTLTKVTPIKKGLEIEREIRVEIEGIRRPGAVIVSVIQLHF